MVNIDDINFSTQSQTSQTVEGKDTPPKGEDLKVSPEGETGGEVVKGTTTMVEEPPVVEKPTFNFKEVFGEDLDSEDKIKEVIGKHKSQSEEFENYKSKFKDFEDLNETLVDFIKYAKMGGNPNTFWGVMEKDYDAMPDKQVMKEMYFLQNAEFIQRAKAAGKAQSDINKILENRFEKQFEAEYSSNTDEFSEEDIEFNNLNLAANAAINREKLKQMKSELVASIKSQPANSQEATEKIFKEAMEAVKKRKDDIELKFGDSTVKLKNEVHEKDIYEAMTKFTSYEDYVNKEIVYRNFEKFAEKIYKAGLEAGEKRGKTEIQKALINPQVSSKDSEDNRQEQGKKINSLEDFNKALDKGQIKF